MSKVDLSVKVGPMFLNFENIMTGETKIPQPVIRLNCKCIFVVFLLCDVDYVPRFNGPSALYSLTFRIPR